MFFSVFIVHTPLCQLTQLNLTMRVNLLTYTYVIIIDITILRTPCNNIHVLKLCYARYMYIHKQNPFHLPIIVYTLIIMQVLFNSLQHNIVVHSHVHAVYSIVDN